MIPNLQQRFFDPSVLEEMDRPDIPREILSRDLDNLRTINRHFGGRNAAKLAIRLSRKHTPITSLLDCACGGGDLTLLQHQSLKPGRSLALDLHPTTLDLARVHVAPAPIDFMAGDLRALPFPDNSIDVVTCHLALHHFPDEEAVQVLRELGRVARRLVVVTDLTRDTWGYLSVWLLVQLWLRDPITRHDALLSVRRAWNPGEFLELARKAGWQTPLHYSFPWFRQAVWWHKNLPV